VTRGVPRLGLRSPHGSPITHPMFETLHHHRALASRGVVREGGVPLSWRPPSHGQRRS
jgi:hypothetical protein